LNELGCSETNGMDEPQTATYMHFRMLPVTASAATHVLALM